MRIHANGIQLEVLDEGPRDGDPLLMIMGLGMQLIAWPDELVAELVARGFRVIRFDNRDIGLSQHFDALGVPSIARAGIRHLLRLPVRAPYTLADMAADALGVLDALGLHAAHVCGASMGGMIAQHLAAAHPERVKSLTLVMTTSGARHLPQPSPRIRGALLKRPGGRDFASIVAHAEWIWRLIGSPAYPPAPQRLRERVEATVRRNWHPAGTSRQLLAIVADSDRSKLINASRRRRWSSTARTTPWCRCMPRTTWWPRSHTPRPTSSPAWGTTCRWSCCRASPSASPPTPCARADPASAATIAACPRTLARPGACRSRP